MFVGVDTWRSMHVSAIVSATGRCCRHRLEIIAIKRLECVVRTTGYDQTTQQHRHSVVWLPAAARAWIPSRPAWGACAGKSCAWRIIRGMKWRQWRFQCSTSTLIPAWRGARGNFLLLSRWLHDVARIRVCFFLGDGIGRRNTRLWCVAVVVDVARTCPTDGEINLPRWRRCGPRNLRNVYTSGFVADLSCTSSSKSVWHLTFKWYSPRMSVVLASTSLTDDTESIEPGCEFWMHREIHMHFLSLHITYAGELASWTYSKISAVLPEFLPYVFIYLLSFIDERQRAVNCHRHVAEVWI